MSKHGALVGHFYDKEFDRKPKFVKAKYLNKQKEDPYCTKCACC